MAKSEVKIGSVLSYIGMALHIVVGLIYTPIMLRLMGQSEYGTYSLVASVIGYLSILDLGFGNAIIVYTARFRAKKQEEQQAKLNGMFLIIYSIIGVIAGIIGVILYFNIENMFGANMTIEELSKAKTMFLILIVNLIFTFPLSIFGSIITAYEKYIFSKIVNIVKILLMPCIMLPLLYMGYRSITMTFVATILNLGCLLINCAYCLKSIKLKFKFKSFDKKLLTEIFGYSFFIFLAIIVDKINTNIDQFILGSVIGTVQVAIYSVALQFNTIYVSLSTAVNSILLPRVTIMVANKEDNSKISDVFIKAGRIQYVIIALVITGFIIFGQEFIKIWAGEGYEESFWTALLLMVPAVVPLIQNVGINILQAKNLHKFRTIIYFFIAIGNLFISIPLAKQYGAIGSAAGTAIALVIGQIIIMNIYYYKKAKIDIPRFWKDIFKMSIPIIFLFIAFLISNKYILTNSYFVLGIKMLIYVILYGIILYKFSLSDYEKDLICKPIKKIIKK